MIELNLYGGLADNTISLSIKLNLNAFSTIILPTNLITTLLLFCISSLLNMFCTDQSENFF